MHEAKAILNDLGVPTRPVPGRHKGMMDKGDLSQLTDTEMAAFQVAKQANDREAMQAILDEAGITNKDTGSTTKRMRDGRMFEQH